MEGYCLLATRSILPASLDAFQSLTRSGIGHRFELVIDPPATPDPHIRVAMQTALGGPFTQVFDAPLPAGAPRSFEFGFAASTGQGTNIHEVRMVRIDSVDPLPRFTLAANAARVSARKTVRVADTCALRARVRTACSSAPGEARSSGRGGASGHD